jgi:type VI secretion system Hcp family effector
MGKFLMTMTLEKQGKLTASSKTDKGSHITVLPYNFGVMTPRDQTTGQASGKRQHQPITIRKMVDSASPLIFQAVCNNETLKTVHITVSTPGVNQTTVLLDVEIVEIKHLGASEEVTFVFGDWQVNGVPGGNQEPYFDLS